MTEEVRVERHEGWAELIIARPDRRNSITAPVSEALLAGLTQLEADDGVQVVLLRGEGGYFCSGVDLRALQADPPPPWKDRQGSAWRDLHLALFRFTKPVVGALEKFAINAGAALAFACDVVVAGEAAFLQVGEIQQGVGMPMNAAWLRVKATEQVTARLAFYGDRIPGPVLLELGLVAECVPDGEVASRCIAICETIAGFPAGASQKVKQTIIEHRRIDDPEAFFHSAVVSSLDSAGMVR